MAAPSGQLKARPYFVVLAALIALIYALVFFTGDGKPKPKLGLDLVGGTSITMSASSLNGKAPSKEQMSVARQIITQRVDATGVAEAEVTISGTSDIVVNVAGKGQSEKLNHLLDPAKLEFRAVLGNAPDVSASAAAALAAPSPSASASGSAGPTPTSPASAKPTGATAKPSASSSAHGEALTAPSPSTTPKATATPTPTPAPTIAGAPTIDQVKKLPGMATAYAIAAQVTDPTQVDDATLRLLEPFAKLTPDQVAVLPVQYQLYVPTISCQQLNGRNPAYLTDDAYLKQQVVACNSNDSTTPIKQLLDVAKVKGTDVASATTQYDPTNFAPTGWAVNLAFKTSGQAAWTQLTKDAIAAQAQDGQQHQVAIVLDTEVVSAPNIQTEILGPAQITGSGITESFANELATKLRFGALPVSFTKQNGVDVSATLGLQQLKSGMLAGAIGLALVVIYCMFYYRALGFVVIASLLVSASIVFGSLVLLGRSMGFTLSLAGIAGFIVAIGITADSFVVFFERLKDEVKEGRSVRSAVPRAWVRARRTILSADAVSLIASVVLYVLASAQVAGFAFTLGLSTVIDLIVVFLFTHPLVSVLSGARMFSTGRYTGLGDLRGIGTAGAATPGVRLGAMRSKES